MKISRIRILTTQLPYVDGTCTGRAGSAITVANASAVVIDTDAGLQGCGAFAPYGENNTVAHSEGAEAMARIFAPLLIGEDIRSGEITSFVVARSAVSTLKDFLHSTTDLMNENTRSAGVGGPKVLDGWLYASNAPGHGVIAEYTNLGQAVACYGDLI